MQQVNLYSEILRQQQKQSGVDLALAAMAALALLCLGLSVYTWWESHQTETEVHNAQQMLDQKQAQVNKIIASRSNQDASNQLSKEIEQWQSSVNEVAQTLQLLSGNETILSQGFSYYLKALAFKSNPEVWLTDIHIDGLHGDMKLEGSTFKPQQLPQVLQQLQNQSALKGLTFAKLVMDQSSKIAGQIDFTLSSTEKPEDADSHPQ